jgi:hypothetical protein
MFTYSRVKTFGDLDIDSDNYAASHITIVRFHPAIDSRPIDRIPEIE